eukprot:Pgem_evm1s18629
MGSHDRRKRHKKLASSTPPKQSKFPSELENDENSGSSDSEKNGNDSYCIINSGSIPLEIVNQDVYEEHRNPIKHCIFAPDSATLASSDNRGIIKIWNVDSRLSTHLTIKCEPGIQTLEWDPKHDNRR